MSEVETTRQPLKWYNNSRFPLLPRLVHRKPNEHNTRHLSFSWLFLSMWTIDTFSFAIEAKAELGVVYFRIFIPYLIIGLYVPLLPWRYDSFLDRKAKKSWC